jgi:hypothetical protein
MQIDAIKTKHGHPHGVKFDFLLFRIAESQARPQRSTLAVGWQQIFHTAYHRYAFISPYSFILIKA